MGFLEKLGFGKRRARPVGETLEKGVQETGFRHRNTVIKGAIFFGLVAVTLAAFPTEEVYRYSVQVGDRWSRETLTAPFDFAIYKDSESVARERSEVHQTTPPYFLEIPDALDRLEANRDTVSAQLDRTLRSYASFRTNDQRGRQADATADSIRHMETRENARLKLTPDQWSILLDDYTRRIPGLSSTTRSTNGPRLDEELLTRVDRIGKQMLQLGVLDLSVDSVYTDQILIRNDRSNTERPANISGVYGVDEAFQYARDELRRQYGRADYESLGAAFFTAIFTPSLQYMRAETEAERMRKAERISPTQGIVAVGEVIVREGDLVTADVKRKLVSLERAMEQRAGARFRWKSLLGRLIVTLATLIFFFLYLYMLRRQVYDENKMVLLIAVVFALIIGLFSIAIRAPGVWMFAVPVAIASIILTVIFDSRVGLFATITLALIGGLLLNYDFEFTFATLFAGSLGVHSVRDIKNRGQFFISAGIVLLGYLAILLATLLFQETPTELFASDAIQVSVSSFLLLLAYPLLWVFERIFGITTDLTLLELSDTNRPLLKQLSIRASGTFNHSLQVANLSEAAASSVGANALLARVGALYHDVGKMSKPEYFVENQRTGSNVHESLKPRMSALIIANHVKEGLEIGRAYNLPQRVLRFIPMHHGTSLIEFFYDKAKRAAGDADAEIQKSDFRYPGPRPDSKETGILMLADSVEAASRTLGNPTHKRLESLIDRLIRSRVAAGQLDRTDLTFRDLDTIKDSFLALLVGMYHSRVKYPDQEEEPAVDEEFTDTVSIRAAKGPAELERNSEVEAEPAVVRPEGE